MSGTTGGRSIVQQADYKRFKNVSTIRMDNYELHLNQIFLYSEFDIPGYEFLIKIAGENAGMYTVLIETDFTKIFEVGNVSIEINRKYFGVNLPSRTTLAVLPLFKEHGQDKILITTNEGNKAIETACDQLSAIYLDTIKTDQDKVNKKRYILEVNPVLSNNLKLSSSLEQYDQ